MTEPSRYRWRRTFPEAHRDFVAYDGLEQIGRVMHHRNASHSDGVWAWTLTGAGIWPGRRHAGEAPTRAEAIAALLGAWEALKRWSAETGQPLRANGPIYAADGTEAVPEVAPPGGWVAAAAFARHHGRPEPER